MLNPASVADFSSADFADSELDLPYYLSHFHRIANAVEMDGPDRGFINISVWRNPKDNKPHNARIMENILALAFFFCTDRPWNVFYAQPDLRQRLEAALDFWCGIQNSDGRFSEYGPDKWNLAATAFTTKFMGQTLHLLDSGPAIDSALHQRVISADRKALYATFTIDELQTHGRNFTNQYANAWGGALAYLDLFPDSELEHLLDQRLEESLTEFQSPAGYFYERSGPDWGYFLGTHHSDIHSQTDTDHAAWGTIVDNTLCEKTDITATFRINGNSIIPRPGIRDLPDGDLEITYPLGETGSKTIIFASDAITVSVNYPGAFTESLPLLKGSMDTKKSGAVLTRGDVSLHIETESALTFSETDLKSGDRQVVTAYINAENTLTYRIVFR